MRDGKGAEPRQVRAARIAERRGLVEKYRALCDKHSALLRRYEDLSAGRGDRFALYAWAYQHAAFPLALVRAGAVVHRNLAWARLSSRHPGPWATEGSARPRTFLDLAAAAASLQRDLARRGVERDVLRLARDGDCVVDLACERTGPGTAVATVRDVSVETRLARTLRALDERRGPELASALEALVASFAAVERADPGEQRDLLRTLGRALRDAGDQLETLAPAPGTGADLVAAVEGAIVLAGDRLDEVAAARGVAFTTSWDVPPDLPRVLVGDDAALREAFQGLLQDAIEAMPAGGTLEVTARHVGRWIVAGVTAVPALGHRAVVPQEDAARPRGVERASAIARAAGGFVVTTAGRRGELRFRMSLPVASSAASAPGGSAGSASGSVGSLRLVRGVLATDDDGGTPPSS